MAFIKNIQGARITGSITASFTGDGSGLTGIISASNADTASYVDLVAGTNITINQTGTTYTINSTGGGGGGSTFPYTGSAIISGSLQVTGSTSISGALTAAGITYPTTDGDDGDIIFTDGAGNLTFGRTTIFATVKNITAGTLQKGTPVHVTGSVGNTSEVVPASASVALTMPAHFILNEDLTAGSEGKAIAAGFINGVNTSGFTEGDTVYVGVNGGYTNIKPTGSNLIQNLGIVDKIDASNGSGFILGAGRSNDVPNITEGYTWIGNSNGVATPTATSSIQNVVSSSYATTASYAGLYSGNGTIPTSTVATITDTISFISGNVGIGTTTPTDRLFVSGSTGEFRARVDRVLPYTTELYAKTTNPSGSSVIQLVNDSSKSIVMGVLGSNRDASVAYGGESDDAFMFASSNANNLHIFNGAGTGTEDSINFYAGNNAAATPHLHIQGSGSTKGYIGIGTETPQVEFHIKGNSSILRLETTSATNNNYIEFWDPSERKGFLGYVSTATTDGLFIRNDEHDANIVIQNTDSGGTSRTAIEIDGNQNVEIPNGNLKVSGGITGSLLGTASFASNVLFEPGTGTNSTQRKDSLNTASGDYSFAVGQGNNVGGINSVAVGFQNTVTPSYGFAAGYQNTIGSTYGIALGRENIAHTYALSAGLLNTSSVSYAIALGYNNSVLNPAFGGVALGTSHVVSGDRAVALGRENIASGSRSFASGYLNISSHNQTFTHGYLNTASQQYAVAFGRENTSAGIGSIALGYLNYLATGSYSFAAGYNNTIVPSYGGAIGTQNTILSTYGMAFGALNQAGNYAVAAGYNNDATAIYSVALGGSNLASGNGSVALGTTNKSLGSRSIAAGYLVTASADHSVAIGREISANALYSSAVGGRLNNADAIYSGIFAGVNNNVPAAGFSGSVIIGGDSNVNSGSYSAIVGGRNNTIGPGVNNVILGGTNIDSADTSNTVFVPNFYATGSVQAPNIANTETSQVVYYNTSSGAFTYGDKPVPAVVPDATKVFSWFMNVT